MAPATTSAPTVLQIVVSGSTTFDALAQALSNKTGVPRSQIELVRTSPASSSGNATMVVSFGAAQITMAAAVTAAQTIPFVLAASPEATASPTASALQPDSSSFPVGAVVGGVIGALTIILLMWFVYHRVASSRPIAGGKRFDDDCVMMNEHCVGTLDELLVQSVDSRHQL